MVAKHVLGYPTTRRHALPASGGSKHATRSVNAWHPPSGHSVIFVGLGASMILGFRHLREPKAALSLADRWITLFRAPQSAEILGAKVLDISDDYADADAALAYIVRYGDLSLETLLCLPRNDLRKHIRRCIREDFLSQRTVKLDGWVISRTEAHVVALSALRSRA